MGHDERLTVFWVVHLALLGLFCLELLFVLSVWLKARVPGLPADAPRRRKLGAALRFAAGLVFSRRVGALLRALVVDGIVHRRLFRTDARRWAVHMTVFGSWLALGLLSTLTGVVVEVLPLLGMNPEAVASIPLFGQLFHADVWWVALLNEILGLLVIAGMLLVITRRYIRKDPNQRTMPADSIVIGLLTIIALGGFLAESLRLLADYVTASGVLSPDPAMISPERLPPALYDPWGPQWGFVGYLLASLLGALRLSASTWQGAYTVVFWLHFATVSALLFTLPFSRFFHVIMSPVIVAYNTMKAQQARGTPRGGLTRGQP